MTTIALITQLVASQDLSTTDTALYTAPASTVAYIGRAVFTNNGASSLTITAGITGGGAIPSGQNIISAMTLPAGVAYVSPELAGQAIPPGSQLRAYASAGSVNIVVSGVLQA